MTKILVTGVAGYIGSAVAARLINEGYEVTGVDNFATGKETFIPEKIEFIQGDVNNLPLLKSIAKRCDMIAHVAGIKYAGESVKKPGDFYTTNTMGTLNVAEATKFTKFQSVLFSSSCSVYGNPIASVATELTPTVPISPYGRSKKWSEEILGDFHYAYGIKFVSLRYFNVVGVSRHGSYDDSKFNIFPNLSRAINQSEAFNIFGKSFSTHDGTCMRDYVDVNDIAKAHVLSIIEMTSREIVSGPINIGSGHGTSVLDIVHEFEKASRGRIKVEYSDAREGDPDCVIADYKLAHERWGWEPSVKLSESVREHLQVKI
jgi:UDP-glucose 4-epimerase